MLRKSILFTTLLFTTYFSQAQTITYGPVSDYGTLIANIFGIQCEGVSNVQVIGNGSSIGRFENGGAFGLNSGLAMSTGLLQGSAAPSGVFFSYTMNTPPDQDIFNYGQANGQIPTNYDATSISFDFTPVISDTIRFNYIFASEEYPEYSMSSFTDRFLFLVAENGNASQNIAFVPGTTTPVEINTINQYVNSQYYIENNAACPNYNTFVYDGYTTPLSAKFYAQVGATYHIKLVIADVNDTYYDSTIFLDEQEAYNSIAGTVNVNNAPADGLLEVFNFIQDTTLATPIRSITITNGDYSADSLPTGLFHIRFTPDPVLYPNTPPVYFTSGSDWNTATAIGLPCFLSNAGVYSDSLPFTNGTGTVNGFIQIDTSYLKSLSLPMNHALIFLEDSATNTVVAFTYSDSNGMYHFSNIAAGTYTIRLDVPYIPQLTFPYIHLLDDQDVFGVDFDVLPNGIEAVDNMYLSVDAQKEMEVQVYPIPASGILNIRSTSGNYTYTLTDVNGSHLLSGIGSKGTTALDITVYSSGIYFLQLSNGETKRVVIK